MGLGGVKAAQVLPGNASDIVRERKHREGILPIAEVNPGIL
jgi:hypothetical protein